jgi:uncharacterized protein with HEPN domain
MPRDFRVYLEDMLEAAQRIREYTLNITYEQFSGDNMRVDAVLRNLQIIGEAVKNVPPEIKTKYPTLSWEKIGGLRNLLVHEYFRVNLEIIWSIVQEQIELLHREVANILEREN